MRATLSVPAQAASTLAPDAGVSVHRCAAVARVDLAQPHVPRLVHVARRILGSDDLAWDAVQESLILLWHEQHAPGDLVGWLVRTVVHRSLHHARSRRRRRAHEERGGGPGAYGGERCDPVANAQLRELAELWATDWGRYVALKGILATVIVALGALNWRRRGPRLGETDGVASLRRTLLIELGVAALLLLVTALLVVTPLPGE